MYQNLEIVRKLRVATIWMNRPESFNALNEDFIAEITKACKELDSDPSIRVVVIAGRGKHFSAGADLNWMKRTARSSFEEHVTDARKFAGMLRTIFEMKKPSIARVHGAALGGGVGLTAACDMAVASDDAIFAISEVKFGMIPSAISPYVLRAIGPRQAQRYFHTAERISAQRALAIGLINEVVPVTEIDAQIAEMADAIIAGGPLAQEAAKDLLRAVDGTSIDDRLSEETSQRIARQRSTEEAKDGIAAFLEKRPPIWLAG